MDLKERYFSVLDSLPDHVFLFSESGVYIDVYGGEDNATGFDCKSFIGRSLYDVVPQEMAEKCHATILSALESNETQITLYKFDKQCMLDLPAHIDPPEEIWFEGTVKPLSIKINGEKTVVWLAKNITQRHRLEQRLKKLSETDELTGVSNRRTFTASLSQRFEEYQLHHRQFSLILFDIDRFKRINDAIGHLCGDDVIQHVVKVFQSGLRSSDWIGRIGGDEFAIILNDTTQQTASIIATKLCNKLENKKCITDDHQIAVTVSAGVTQVEGNDNDIRTILSRADKAMYKSKTNGRNKVSLYS